MAARLRALPFLACLGKVAADCSAVPPGVRQSSFARTERRAPSLWSESIVWAIMATLLEIFKTPTALGETVSSTI